MAVFTGSASIFQNWAPATVDLLVAKACWVDLQEAGIFGNGHGLIFDAHETVRPVIDWIIGLSG
jgi:hypothetical protein